MYAVTCTPDEEGLAILNATGIPLPGEILTGTSNVYAHQAKANRISPVLWHVTVPHEGFYCKAFMYGYNKIVRAKDQLGEPTASKILLDTNGYPLASGATTIWKETKKYAPLPYAALGFF